ncbi:DMT family transporter [Microbacterium sp. NPDC089189]|uniref:DMT family transporter n=1 Tax=Microbacterium sp. NPDC089189 TaxID=3154972 RepID=UPI003431EBBF
MPSDSSAPAASRLPRAVAIAGAVLVGALTALQAQINGALGAALDDALVASAISFGSGFLILLVLSAVLPGGRAGIVRLGRGVRSRQVPGWMLLGGLAGAFTVFTQGVTVAVIGVAAFTVGLVAGQTVNGIVLDRVGYGPAGVVGITWGRLAGALLVVAAVAVSLVGDGASGIPLWMLLLPFLAGAGVAWQQATNGRLRHVVGSPLTATLVNFAGGSIVLVLAAVIHVAVAGAVPALPGELWLYVGGAIGVVYIFLSAALVRHLGVLQLGLGSVVGLLTTSVVLDVIAPAHAGAPLIVALAAVVIAIAGVVIAVVPRWRRR